LEVKVGAGDICLTIHCVCIEWGDILDVAYMAKN
jgi:hypothetical protein